MMIERFLLVPAVCAAAAVALVACGVKKTETVELNPDELEVQAPALDEITLVLKEDGKFYQEGRKKPFGGVDVEERIEVDADGNEKRFVIETPYRSGVIDGVKRTYFSGGSVREERHYKKGKPLHVVGYYSDGSKKLERLLNDQDVAEGPSKRWHRNGTLANEGSYDAHEEHHGIWKEYAEDGSLCGQYEWEHGKLKRIIFETDTQRGRRLVHYGEVEGANNTPPAAGVAPR
ncbi:toxin-antitoxin system YwqK family antitoxin [Sulfuriroseicoccus oceanibius]|uniref:MORN repeat variant n=1 Tax=Sulfuriroseicoccus oceanibius TaxID=2707525 RepID=A0A6B3LAK5_9BACT|nr:hypothetical protein [Sulfuriroseicoccus oceanibius]QQL45538.1 hypothetical protein G3M56_002810 [Sulfuriroseicoccus oceanibius]